MEVVCSQCVSECRSLGSTLVAAASTLALFLAANYALDAELHLDLNLFVAFTLPFAPLLLSVRAVVNVWVLKRELKKKGPPLDSMRLDGRSTVAIMAYCPIFIQILTNWEHIEDLGIDEKIWTEEEVQDLFPLELPPRPPPPSTSNHNRPAAATAQQQSVPFNNSSSCHYLYIPSGDSPFTENTLGAREVLLELGLVPEYKQIRFLRSRSTFQAIVTVLQAAGYMLGVAARMVEHLGISPLEAIFAFLSLLVTLQLLMEMYACTHYGRPLLLRLNTDQFNSFHEKLRSSAQDHQKTRFLPVWRTCAMVIPFFILSIALLMQYSLSSHCHLCSISISSSVFLHYFSSFSVYPYVILNFVHNYTHF